MFLAGLCFDLLCFSSFFLGGGVEYPCAYAFGIILLLCVVHFSHFLQDSVTPEDREKTPAELLVVETTFGVGDGVVAPSA